MTWARLDDKFDSHRKTMRAWKLNRASVGLHIMAITYTCGHELDGMVDPEFVETKLPKPAERKKAIEALLSAGLWEACGDGWQIHDFLDYNPSSADLKTKRAAEAARKAAARASAGTAT